MTRIQGKVWEGVVVWKDPKKINWEEQHVVIAKSIRWVQEEHMEVLKSHEVKALAKQEQTCVMQ